MQLKVKAEFFYTDDKMLASTDPGWLYTTFDTMIFGRVGLQINVRKTVGVVCHQFRAAGVWAEEAYIRSMTGKGRSCK